MKRKVMAMVLTAIMTAGMLAGCSGTKDVQQGGTEISSADSGAEVGTSEKSVNGDGTVNNPDDVKIEDGKLAFWSMFSGGDGEFMDQIISDYNAGGPSKQVQPVMLVWADYYTKLQTAVAAKKGPDIGVSHVSKLPELVEQGVVESITPYLEELGVDLNSMFAENSLDSVTFDGEVYAVPLDTHAGIVYYNKDILEKAGVELNEAGQMNIESEKDFFDILDKCRPVLGDGESPIALMDKGDDPYRVWWATYFQMGGTPLVNEEGTEVTLEKDTAVKAAEFVKKLFDEGYAVGGIDDPMKYFQSGKAAIYIGGGTWGTGALEKTESLNFGAQAWPKLFDNDSCWADAHTFILPVNARRSKEDTKSAVEFMLSASGDGGVTWAGSGQIPANKKALESQEYNDMPYRSGYKIALETAVLPAKNPHFYAMKTGIIESLNGLWSNTSDAKDAIDALYGELESNLE